MARSSLEDLYARFIDERDLGALATLFDRVAHDLARVARRVEGRGARAEDLVQETFLLAIERPKTYDRSRPLLPWLLGILAHRARAERRAAARATSEEEADSTTACTPLEELSGREFRQQVDEALGELPQVTRRAVTGRLIGERSHAQLAEDLGVEEGAVRVRVHRGLMKLRAVLPGALAGLLAWSTPTPGLAQVRARVLERAAFRTGSSAPALAATSAGLGVIYMSKKSLLIVAALLLGTAGVWLGVEALRPAPAPERSAAAPVLVTPPSTHTVAEAGAAEGDREVATNPITTPEEEPVASAPEPVAGFPLSGVVIDQEGLPVANAEVLAWNSRYNSAEPDLRVRSGGDGRFEFESLGPQFVITAGTRDLACVQGLRGTLNEGVVAEGLLVKLAPATSISGVVLDPKRVPIEGAKVEVRNGLYSYSSSESTHVEGVSTFRAGRGQVRTDQRGSFEIHGLSGARQVRVEAPPHLVQRATRPQDGSLFEIVMDAGLELRGRVTDSDGAPAEGARVRFWPAFSNVHLVPTWQTCDEAGRFHLRGLSRGEDLYAIGVQHDGHALKIVEGVEPGEDGGRAVDVQLEPERRLVGRVLDGSGAALPDVTVTYESEHSVSWDHPYPHEASTWENVMGLQKAVTDDEGRFQFAHVPSGPLEVRAHDPADRRRFVSRAAGERTESVELILSAAGLDKVVLTGTVRDATTGEPVQEFSMSPFIDDSATARTFEDLDGRFRVAGLPPGPIALSVSSPGYAVFMAEEQVFAVGEHAFDITLAPARSLTVEALDAKGQHHPRGVISVLDDDGNPMMVERGMGSSNAPVRLRNGSASLHGLPARPVLVRVSVGSDVKEVQVDLTRPHPEPLVVVVETTPTVRVGFAAFEFDASLADDEILAVWSARDPKFREWLTGGLVRAPSHDLRFQVRDGEKLLATAQLTSISAEECTVETARNRAAASTMFGSVGETAIDFLGAGSAQGSEHTGPPSFGWSLPARVLTLTGESEGYTRIERTLDLTTHSSEAPTLFILRR